jgi:ATP-dependent DNA helicase RecQ
MRNQIEMAARIGVRAYTIHSGNREELDAVEMALAQDACDVLLISPERLNNERFLQSVLPGMSGRVGLFVVDEAHCISDWGHDFRPDYRRIVRILQMLPHGIPVLGTTATANNRVVKDVAEQLGPNLTVLRGSLERDALRLQNIRLANQSERLAWLVENLSKFSGSGIVYCLTVPDTERVAAWLQQKGFSAAAYHAGEETHIDRPALEQAFLHNEVQILVATVALGMGFDKADISFVIHYQRPGSVVAYYQQVGRAGRAVDRAYGILLSGVEDDEIQEYFIQSAFPSLQVMQEILAALEEAESLSQTELMARVNINKSKLDKALKLLEVEGAVGISFEKRAHYFRTPNPWQPDVERIERLTHLRRAELAEMQAYVTHSGCLMEFLQRALDDPAPHPCGRCANCRRKGLPSVVSPVLVREAEEFLKGATISIKPRKMWPVGILPDEKRKIPEEYRNAEGRSLCYYGDAGWGKLVRQGKYMDGQFSDELVEAAARLIQERWAPEPRPEWVTCIPSRRHPELVPNFAQRLADRLGLPFCPVLIRTVDVPEQKTMENSSMQARNVFGSLSLKGSIPDRPVLLVDDILDSGWTLTMAGWILRTHGSGVVSPFTLAQATGR